MPDFLLFTDKKVWAVEPKGRHLVHAAVRQKLLDLRGCGVEIAFVLDGRFDYTHDAGPTKRGPDGVTLIRPKVGLVRAKEYDSIDRLFADLLK